MATMLNGTCDKKNQYQGEQKEQRKGIIELCRIMSWFKRPCIIIGVTGEFWRYDKAKEYDELIDEYRRIAQEEFNIPTLTGAEYWPLFKTRTDYLDSYGLPDHFHLDGDHLPTVARMEQMVCEILRALFVI